MFFCAPRIRALTPYTGAMPGIKAFVAAVFGGIGSDPGCIYRRNPAWYYRNFQQGVYFFPDGGRNRVCSTDRCAACEAYRTSR